MNDSAGSPFDTNKCIADLRERNVTPILAVYGHEEMLIDSRKVLLTRIIPATVTCPFGILLNCLYLYVVVRVRSMHTLTNMYLSNQAVVDCMFLVLYCLQAVGEPISSDIIHDKTYLGAAGCLLVNILLDVFLFVSEFNIVLVTFERYMAICRPFTADRISSKSRTRKLIILTWVVGLAFSTPMVYFYTDWTSVCVIWQGPANATANLPLSYSNCWRHLTKVTEGVLFTFPPLIAFSLALTTIFVLNALTFRELRRGTKHYRPNTHDSKMRLFQQRQIVVMLAVTAAVFFFCLFPYHLDLLIAFLNSVPGRQPIVMPKSWQELVRWLPLVSASTNPIIYGILNKQCRNAFRSAMLCRSRLHSGRDHSTYRLTSTSTASRKGSDIYERAVNDITSK
ncbi:thyrotropin-releasing hormone receptor-like [Ptychodera flava]|uniref:thyrotropin-releasing hormone receptor-like n=1 Tax=Ptychodera flava TaxID=63121 RepID=UPI003969C4BA